MCKQLTYTNPKYNNYEKDDMGELAIGHHYTSLFKQLGSMKVLEMELQRDCWASGAGYFFSGNTGIFLANFLLAVVKWEMEDCWVI